MVFLSQSELSILLDLQSKDNLMLSQIIVDSLNLMTEAQLAGYIHSFQEYYNLTEADYSNIVDNNVKTVIEKIATIEKDNLFFHLGICVLNMFVRLIDRNAVVLKPYFTGEEVFLNCAYQKCTGDSKAIIAIATKTDNMIGLAEKFSKEQYPEINALCQDSVKEFLNCCSGLFVSTLEKEKVADLNIEIPSFSFQKNTVAIYGAAYQNKLRLGLCCIS